MAHGSPVESHRAIGGDEKVWERATLLVALAGLLLRFALYFPLAAFPADSDGAVSGLCGLQALDGDLLVFSPDGTRHSAVRCHVAALFFALFGPGRTGLALTGLVFEAAFVGFMFLFLRRVLDARRAFLAMLFVAVPPVEYLIATYVPWGYGEVMAASAAILYSAARWREGAGPWIVFGFGLSVGLALWFSLQSIMVSGPAAFWIVSRRRGAVVAEMWSALLGALLGFAPWLIYNFAHGFPSLTENFAARPAAGLAQMWDNVLYLAAYNLPMLLAGGSSRNWALVNTALVAAYLVLGLGVLLALRTPEPQGAEEDLRSLLLLGVMVIALTLILSVVSEPGSIRGWTVRYIGPLYLVMPMLMAIGAWQLATTSPWLATAPVTIILGLNLAQYSLPGSETRAALRAELVQHARLQSRLEQEGIDVVIGDFWLVYHLNFDSGRKLIAVPFQRNSDYFNVWHSLPEKNVRWAMLGRDDADLQKRAGRAGAAGNIVDFEGLRLFLPEPPTSNQPTRELLDALRGMQ